MRTKKDYSKQLLVVLVLVILIFGYFSLSSWINRGDTHLKNSGDIAAVAFGNFQKQCKNNKGSFCRDIDNFKSPLLEKLNYRFLVSLDENSDEIKCVDCGITDDSYKVIYQVKNKDVEYHFLLTSSTLKAERLE